MLHQKLHILDVLLLCNILVSVNQRQPSYGEEYENVNDSGHRTTGYPGQPNGENGQAIRHTFAVLFSRESGIDDLSVYIMCCFCCEPRS